MQAAGFLFQQSIKDTAVFIGGKIVKCVSDVTFRQATLSQ